MIAHLQGREKAVEELGFKPREAEWIALVALHSGVFLRSQYGRFRGVRSRVPAHRLVDSLLQNGIAVECDSPGLGRVCRLYARAVYRVLGAEHIRHRKDAAADTVLRRLLSLDCVLGDLNRSWLPTEQEKVAAFEALGIERKAFPRRIYGSPKGGRTVRPFGWKMPVAFGDGIARFVYVDTGGETHDELLSWGAEHASLWSALAERGVRVEVVAVSASGERVTGAARVLTRWKERGIQGPAARMSNALLEELKVAERALAALDDVAMSKWGGLNGAIKRVAELQRKREISGRGRQDRVRPDEVHALLAGLGPTGR